MNLKDWIKRSPYNQEEIAEKLGISQSHVSRVCTKGTNSLQLAAQIMELTGGAVTFADLLPKSGADV